MKENLIAASISKLIDCNFSLGNPSKGFDCYNSLKYFYDGCGITFPTHFKDWDIKNYPDKWVDDPEKGRQIFFEFLTSLGKSVDKHYVLRGDLLILKAKINENRKSWTRRFINQMKEASDLMRKLINRIIEDKCLYTFPAIYLGNGHIFILFDKGGKVVPYKFFKKFVIDVRRFGD